MGGRSFNITSAAFIDTLVHRVQCRVYSIQCIVYSVNVGVVAARYSLLQGTGL